MTAKLTQQPTGHNICSICLGERKLPPDTLTKRVTITEALTERLVNQCNIGEGHISWCAAEASTDTTGTNNKPIFTQASTQIVSSATASTTGGRQPSDTLHKNGRLVMQLYLFKKRSDIPSNNAAISRQTTQRYPFKQRSDIPSNNAAISLQTTQRYPFIQRSYIPSNNAAISLQTMRYPFKQRSDIPSNNTAISLQTTQRYLLKQRSDIPQTTQRYPFKQCSDIPSNNAAISLQTTQRYPFTQRSDIPSNVVFLTLILHLHRKHIPLTHHTILCPLM